MINILIDTSNPGRAIKAKTINVVAIRCKGAFISALLKIYDGVCFIYIYIYIYK